MNRKSVFPFLLILSASLLVSPGRLFPQQENSPGKLTREQQEEFSCWGNRMARIEKTVAPRRIRCLDIIMIPTPLFPWHFSYQSEDLKQGIVFN